MWQKLVDRLILKSLFDKRSMQSDQEVEDVAFFVTFTAAYISNIENICYLLMIATFCLNTNLISMVLPLSIFLYAKIDYPKPSKKYWNAIMIYVIITIALKYLVQLPIFCDSPAWHVQNCSSVEVPYT